MIAPKSFVSENENRSREALPACGYCLHCMTNLKALRQCGIAGHLLCLRARDIRMTKKGYVKVYFGEGMRRFFFVKNEPQTVFMTITPGTNETDAETAKIAAFRPSLRTLRTGMEAHVSELSERLSACRESIDAVRNEKTNIKPFTCPDANPEEEDTLYVDTKIRHGYPERLRHAVYLEEFAAREAKLSEIIRDVETEIREIREFVGNIAAPYVQPIVRGFLRRRFDLQHAADTEDRSREISALKIQCIWRILTAKRLTRAAGRRLQQRREIESARVLQCLVRTRAAKAECDRRRVERDRATRNSAATRIQALRRKLALTRRYKIRLRIVQAEREAARVRKSIVTIQRTIRGHLARSRLHAMRLREHIHPRLRGHSEKYVRSGDFWRMLLAIDEDYKRMEEERHIENDHAVTFVREIVQDRNARFAQRRREWAEVAQRALMGPALESLKRAERAYGADDRSRAPSTRERYVSRRGRRTSSSSSNVAAMTTQQRGRHRRHRRSEDERVAEDDELDSPYLRISTTARAVTSHFSDLHKSVKLDTKEAVSASEYALKSLDESVQRLLTLAVLRSYPPSIHPTLHGRTKQQGDAVDATLQAELRERFELAENLVPVSATAERERLRKFRRWADLPVSLRKIRDEEQASLRAKTYADRLANRSSFVTAGDLARLLQSEAQSDGTSTRRSRRKHNPRALRTRLTTSFGFPALLARTVVSMLCETMLRINSQRRERVHHAFHHANLDLRCSAKRSLIWDQRAVPAGTLRLPHMEEETRLVLAEPKKDTETTSDAENVRTEAERLLNIFRKRAAAPSDADESVGRFLVRVALTAYGGEGIWGNESRTLETLDSDVVEARADTSIRDRLVSHTKRIESIVGTYVSALAREDVRTVRELRERVGDYAKHSHLLKVCGVPRGLSEAIRGYLEIAGSAVSNTYDARFARSSMDAVPPLSRRGHHRPVSVRALLDRPKSVREIRSERSRTASQEAQRWPRTYMHAMQRRVASRDARKEEYVQWKETGREWEKLLSKETRATTSKRTRRRPKTTRDLEITTASANDEEMWKHYPEDMAWMARASGGGKFGATV